MCVNSITVQNGHDVVCGGGSSCNLAGLIDTQLSVGGGIYCVGEASCNQVTLNGESTSGIIVCGSRAACDQSVINFAKSLYCGGAISCQRGEINGIENIYVTGYTGIGRSTINTAGRPVTNLYLAAYHIGVDTININCQAGDFCNVHCKTRGACSGLIMNAVCTNYFIECGSGFTCPSVNDDRSSCNPS